MTNQTLSHPEACISEFGYYKARTFPAFCAKGQYDFSASKETQKNSGWIATMLVAAIALVAVSGLATLLA